MRSAARPPNRPQQLNYDAISRSFGTPKPTLANSYSPELLNLRTFPTLMGYSSRILAESWESNLLYYAALADQLHFAPAELNVLVPAWTRETVERIFATHLEDWPALLRSLAHGRRGRPARRPASRRPPPEPVYNPTCWIFGGFLDIHSSKRCWPEPDCCLLALRYGSSRRNGPPSGSKSTWWC